MRSFWGLLLLSLGLILPASAETFRNPRHIAIPSNPAQVGTADFNGDGRPDFYYTDAIGLHVILAKADGSYGAPQTTSLGATNIGCRAADFNGDGFADAVCFTPLYSATASMAAVFSGNGDGSLHLTSTVPIPGGSRSGTNLLSYVAFADINSDSHLDIVFQDSATGLLYTWFGDGTGQFQALVSYPQPLVESPQSATVADINGDGHPDILFAYDPLVMFGVGDGTFTGAYTVGPWTGCHLADFDQDGHLDLFCTLVNYKNGENYLEIHHGNPDGTFTKTPVFSKGYLNADFTLPFAARDLDGDGYLDVLGLSADGLVIFFGRPGVHFAAPVHYAFYNVGGFDQEQGDPSLIADYDGDGNPDLAMPGVNGIYITYGKPDGTFDALPVIRSGPTAGYSAVADFNEDGTPDIFTSGATALQLNLGKGDGTFGTPVTVQAPVSPQTLDTAALLYAGDFNGDKHKDVIAVGPAADGTSHPHLFAGRGDGTFEDPVVVGTFAGGCTPLCTGASVADMNGDGRDDLVDIESGAGLQTSSVDVFLSKGDGTFEAVLTTLTPGSYSSPVPGDCNGDGKIDLVLTTQQTIELLLGRGDGTFDIAPQTLSIPGYESRSPNYISRATLGDFDHDGKVDIGILANYPPTGTEVYDGPAVIFIYYGKGDGTFASPVMAAILNRLYLNFFASDLNGDGLLDFVLSTVGSNNMYFDYEGTAISIVHSLPGRKFSAETNLIAGEGFASVAVADFTRDGQPDLLFTNGTPADSLVLLTNVGTPAVALTSNANPSVIGQAVTFTAMISAPADLTALPGPGTIIFEGLPDGNVSVPITFAGGGSHGPFKATATYETAGLPVGSTLITAAFPGDSFLNAAHASLTQVVNPPAAYQLVVSPTTIEITAGATANNSVTITVKSLHGFTGTVSLSCKVAYLGTGTDASPPACGFATNPLSVKGADVSTQLSIGTTAATTTDKRVAGNGGLDKTGIVLCGGALLLLLPGRLRYRKLAVAMVILVLTGSMLSLSSCGDAGGSGGPSGSSGPLPPTGSPDTETRSYSVTVSAASNTTVPAPPPVTVQLTVD